MLTALASLAWITVATPLAQAGTLDIVKSRGILHCGVNTNVAGFSLPDSQGVWRGLDVDLCRAVAAAVLGDATKVRFSPLTATQRFVALQSGEIDVLIRQTTLTLSRDTTLGLRMVHPYLYDGHGFMVRRDAHLRSAKDLTDAAICLIGGSSNDATTSDWARTNNIPYRPVLFERIGEAADALFAGRCDALGTDATQLAAMRSATTHPEDWEILPDRISKEPYGPVVRRDDQEWFEVIRWTVMAVIAAEELGVNQTNVAQQVTSPNPEVRRLLGAVPDTGQALKLNKDWGFQIVRQVGNYGEIYERNLGPQTPIKLPRGLNDQYTRGGLLYAWPLR
ncbi:MAG: amino acid ABC transporter substrate-binding protein [Acetobacteraceae bacterium]